MRKTRLILTLEARGDDGEATLRKIVGLLYERLAERAGTSTTPEPDRPEPVERR